MEPHQELCVLAIGERVVRSQPTSPVLPNPTDAHERSNTSRAEADWRAPPLPPTAVRRVRLLRGDLGEPVGDTDCAALDIHAGSSHEERPLESW